MKNALLALMVLAGLSFASLAQADSARTIPFKSRAVVSDPVLVSSAGVVVYRVDGFADTSNCTYSLHNTGTFMNGTVANTRGAEGGEATQYDSFPSIDFGRKDCFLRAGCLFIPLIAP